MQEDKRSQKVSDVGELEEFAIDLFITIHGGHETIESWNFQNDAVKGIYFGQAVRLINLGYNRKEAQ